MITDQQYNDWLKDDSALRCILIEATPNLGGVGTPVYISNRGFTTKPTDTPANTEYLPLLQGGVKITESASVEGNASMSYGTIELENNTGEYDSWLDGVWVNRPVTILFGDIRWGRADFRSVFKGIIADIDSSARNRLNLKLRDRLQLLNNPIQETKLGGLTANKDRIFPVLFGECHNFEALLTDPPNHEYCFHYGFAEGVIEVRDDGVPVTVTPLITATKSSFQLSGSPKGTITVSAQGDKTGSYSNSLVGIVTKLVKNFGRSDSRFTDADLDTTSLAAFDTANPAPMGIYLGDKANVLETCQNLAASIGAMLVTSRQGLLKIFQLKPALGAADATVVIEDDMVNGSLKIVERSEVSASVKLGYCQNYSVQENLQSGIPLANRDMFALDWLTTTQEDAAVKALYKLHAVPEQEDTHLQVESDAITEANRRLSIRKVPHTIYQYTGFADALSLELGKEIFLTHHRYGLTAGKYGVIVGLEPDWLARRCTVKVMI